MRKMCYLMPAAAQKGAPAPAPPLTFPVPQASALHSSFLTGNVSHLRVTLVFCYLHTLTSSHCQRHRSRCELGQTCCFWYCQTIGELTLCRETSARNFIMKITTVFARDPFLWDPTKTSELVPWPHHTSISILNSQAEEYSPKGIPAAVPSCTTRVPSGLYQK